jgi:hypothetical protein
MNTPEPTRPLEEGIDESNEAIVLERLKTVDQDKKTAAPWPEVKKRILAKTLVP